MAKTVVQIGTKRIVRPRPTQGSRADKSPPVATKPLAPPRDPTVCDSCGAFYTRKRWRRPAGLTFVRAGSADWGTCPACAEVRAGVAHGRVLVQGTWAAAHEREIRARIANVAARAAHTQPERRLLSVERTPDGGLEVLTTSQKLAHRIAAALARAFRGRASYRWDDGDGSLDAVWRREA